jgi:sugar phosphate permease
MSGGVVAALLVGWLMDHVGLEVCTAVTLALGQIQVIVLVWLANQRFYLVAR